MRACKVEEGRNGGACLVGFHIKEESTSGVRQQCMRVCVHAWKQVYRCVCEGVFSEHADMFEWYCLFMHFNQTVFPFFLLVCFLRSHNCTRWQQRRRPRPHSRNAGNSISVSQHSTKIWVEQQTHTRTHKHTRAHALHMIAMLDSNLHRGKRTTCSKNSLFFLHTY